MNFATFAGQGASALALQLGLDAQEAKQLIARFDWMLPVFGIFLLGTGVKMFFLDTGAASAGQARMVNWIRRWFPVTEAYHGDRFLIRDAAGALVLTPLAVALVLVETTDLLFAVDSIPAILAITADPFLVFASNAFAILGLRSLYFALAGALEAFHYLKYSLAVVLMLIGGKMECASCHDIHRQKGNSMRSGIYGKIGGAGARNSDLCLTCHKK